MSRGFALALLVSVAAMPAAVAAQNQCRTIRAMTNADGRRFADLSLGVAANPYRMTVRAGHGDGLPTPDNCDLSADADAIDMSCYWRPGDYVATAALFDSLFARLQQCLGGRLAAPVGAQPYGDATALRRSETELQLGGETRVGLFLIEAPQTDGIAGYHYILLSVSHQPADPASDDREN